MKQELPKAYNPHEVEERLYRMWEERGYFRARPDPDKLSYSIVIPPPNITGILHMGHALNNTIQDILIRFNRMKGCETEWMPGTDHAGIATQNVVERKLQKDGIRRQDLGRDKFVEAVWKWREEYGSTIIRQLKKLGCSCDWERTRFTMDEGLSDAVLEVFLRLYKKGLIYKGNYIINWCPRCLTALSDEESQHKDVEGMLYYIKYPVSSGFGVRGSGIGKKSKAAKDVTNNEQRTTNNEYVVVATTRPETMLGDTGIAVNPKDKRYKTLKGKTVILPILNRELKVIYDGLVDMKFGTGALKVTPAHDPVDFELGMKHHLDQINVMNDDATINSNGGEYEGMDRLEAREAIIEDLKERGLFIKSEPHRHTVGHCYRCHTMVEPRLSPQWFVRMKPLARPAIEAVKKGKIKFYPKRWTKVYLDWMNNIRDWCISRQIWWGHRIPVYYCKQCGSDDPSFVVRRSSFGKDKKSFTHDGIRDTEYGIRGVIVSKTHPEKCPTCGSSEITQDPDVLDTWFSSWLWPFSTFGWPKETPELKYFYPTNALITAQEIIFFWVARMIMAGMEFMKEVPFRDVYIHGTVRDITGMKMSKSLGNIIDPLDIINKYGTDALRFSMISITSEGQDVYLSESRFQLGRNFANKIWNASRFILMNMKEEDVRSDLCVFYKTAALSFPDRWILSRFYSTLSHLSRCLENYRFNDAANSAYEFFWHEFCDWYIEMVKPSLIVETRNQKPARPGSSYRRAGETRKIKEIILYKILEKSLRMLHPFMPFVTEEIWQKLPREHAGSGGSIMAGPWPHIQKEMISADVEAKMSRLISLITAIRNIRAVWNIEPAREIAAIANVHKAGDEKFLLENSDIVKKLTRVSDFRAGRFPKPKSSAVSVVGDIEVYVPLEGLIDFGKESSRLMKEKARLEDEAKSIAGRLSDKNFLSKAPKEVVEKHRVRREELALQIKKLSENLRDIS